MHVSHRNIKIEFGAETYDSGFKVGVIETSLLSSCSSFIFLTD
jgi:hypothetical protein